MPSSSLTSTVKSSRRMFACCFGLLALLAAEATAQWYPDGTPVSTEVDHQEFVRLAGDGAGGVVVVWIDRRNTTDYDVYAQRYSAFGVAQWAAGGVAVCTARGDQTQPDVIADGFGGACIAWWDNRAGNLDVYAQHVSHGGIPQWTADGEIVCDDPAAQGAAGLGGPRLVRSDSKVIDDTGVIIAWEDARNGPYDIYAQRMNAGGAVWTANGVVVCGAAESQVFPQLVPSGSGGAVATWQDSRAGTSFAIDIYAQRVDIDGNRQWTPADGKPMCTAADEQRNPRAVGDGADGIIVAWNDHRLGFLSPWNVYAQRLDETGAPVWTTDGVQVHSNSEVDAPEVVSDGSGGAVVAWRDKRNGHADVFAQRLDGTGAKQWSVLGVSLVGSSGDQNNHQAAPDGAGGAFVVWDGGSPVETRIQHVDNGGTVSFGTDGHLVSGAASHQLLPAVAANGGEPAFVGWADYRAGGDPDVYLTAVWATVTGVGDAGRTPPPVAVRVTAAPNPVASKTDIRVSAFERGTVTVDIFDAAGRRVARRQISVGPDGSGVWRFDARDGEGIPLPSGVYLIRARAPGRSATAKLVLTR